MALQKAYEDKSGNIGDYWRVDSIQLERDGMMLEARLNLYKSKADRAGGKKRMRHQIQVTMPIPAGNPTLGALIAAIYEYLKTNKHSQQNLEDVDPYFADSVDI